MKLCLALSILCLLIAPLAFSTAAAAEEFPGDISFGGWLRAQYGTGDRYPESQGEDSFGVQQLGLLGSWKYENFEAIVLLGGELLSADNSLDGDIGIKDAFIVWSEIGGSDFGLSVGAQPLFFGLKANGFPGDRSLQPSLEFGGGGGFAVSQQAGTSILFNYDLGETGKLTAGFFDTSSSTAAYFAQTGLGDIDGSSLTKNYFLELTFDQLGVDGLYGVLGYEERYVGGPVDSSEPIFDIGLGYTNDHFDLSVEYISLDRSLTNTLDDDAYLVAELTLTPTDRLSLLADWAQSDEEELETLRVGIVYQIVKTTKVHFEYSNDDLGTRAFVLDDEVDSLDVRLTLEF